VSVSESCAIVNRSAGFHLPPREWKISLLEMSQGISTSVVIYASTANKTEIAPKRVHVHASPAAATTLYAMSVWSVS